MANVSEKHQRLLADLLREEANRVCGDCGSRGPRWASWNLGVFLCIRCAGIHRNLGVHISRVKSVNLDSWTAEQIECIQQGGNDKARALYEASLPSDYKRPLDDYAVEQFIRSKYVRKTWMAKDAGTAGRQSKPKMERKDKALKEGKSSPSTSKKSELKPVPRPHTLSPGAPSSRSSSAPARQTPVAEAPPLLDLEASDAPQAAPLSQMPLTTSAPSSNLSLLDDPTPPTAVVSGEHTPQLPFGVDTPQRAVSQPLDREAILSLYSSNPSHNGGLPNVAYHHGYPYHQQQMTVLHAQQQVYYSQMQNQVAKVQEQMARLRMRQHQHQSPAHGDTLNPHLW